MSNISKYFQKNAVHSSSKKTGPSNFFAKLNDLKKTNKINIHNYDIINKFIQLGYPISYMANVQKILSKYDGMNDELKKVYPQYMTNKDDTSIIIKEILDDEDKSWSKSQKQCINNIIKFLYDPVCTTCDLFGFAGTGKTTVIVDIIFKLRAKKLIRSVSLTAPTNKAVNIMKSKLNLLRDKKDLDQKIEFCTIHKLLQYENDFDMDGAKIFVKNKKSLLDKYNIIVIDECSMISESVLKDIKADIDVCVEEGIIPKIIFAGDPAQLNPVNELSSLVFDTEYFKSKYCSLMTDIVRTSDNNVVKLCNNVRKWVVGDISKPSIGQFKCPTIRFHRKKANARKTDSNWFTKYMNGSDKEGCKYIDNSIIITWTNNATNTYNNEIRKRTFEKKKKIEKFEVNDKLIFNDFYKMPEIKSKDGLKFYTSEQVKIIKVKIITKKFKELNYKEICKNVKLSEHTSLETKYIKCFNEINSGTTRTYKLWKLDVYRVLDSGEIDSSKIYKIYVVHDDDVENLRVEKNYGQFLIKTLWKYYQTNHAKHSDSILTNIIKPMWKQWADVFIDSFASVEYGNSITTHKAQGSTYVHVFVDMHDILINKNDDECKRCIYTALGRPSKELHIIMPSLG